MSNLWVVIPAAGKSQRFIDAGYTTIKPLLELKAPNRKTALMLDFVYNTVPKGLPIIVGLPMGTKLDIGDRSIMDCIEEGLDAAEQSSDKHFIQYIDKTRGQADSVYQMIKHLSSNDSCLILDCDMLLRTDDIQKLIDLLQVYDVTIAVTETFDPNSSRVDSIPFPSQIVEKQPISQYGIVGARAFKSIDLLTKALKKTLKESVTEPYLSHAIGGYSGVKYAHLISEYVDLGTPERIREAGWEII